VFRPLVPIQHREAVFQSLHYTPPRGAGNPPPHRHAVLLAANGQGHNSDGQGLPALPAGKVHIHVHLQPAEIPVPHRRFAHIHVNLVGSLPPSCCHTYLFTIIDRTSRWPESIPLWSITAADCARALFEGWYRGLKSLTPSHQTGGPSSRPPYGRACAVCSTSSIHP
jgi:hypothetical protein